MQSRANRPNIESSSREDEMKRAIVIGASAGIGEGVARVFSEKGYEVGITARRRELLEELAEKLPGPAHVMPMDVALAVEAVDKLHALIDTMGGMDVLVISAGIGNRAEGKLVWEDEKRQIDVNVAGFAALAGAGFNYFLDRGRGRLAGISSFAGLRGNHVNPMYAASKAFVSTYLEGLRLRAGKMGVEMSVTDIRAGFVDTELSRSPVKWLAAPVEKAAREIFACIERGARAAYVPAPWKLAALPYRLIPDILYEQF